MDTTQLGRPGKSA